MVLFAGFAVCAGVAGAAQLDGNFDALSCQLLVLSNFIMMAHSTRFLNSSQPYS